ncbi:hypothetical protein CLOM_g14077 [Closterium sp. NIES-68]|nr:hypothetical protein CLOM_g14077 [Closterium sp. NIES-68]
MGCDAAAAAGGGGGGVAAAAAAAEEKELIRSGSKEKGREGRQGVPLRRRRNRIKSERSRRKRVSNAVEDLRMLVPAPVSAPTDMASVLEATAAYIRELRTLADTLQGIVLDKQASED